VLTPLRRALNAATRFRIVRAPTLAAIRALTRLSATLLGGVDSVAAVYARGSYGRGDFRPFISDIDFAIAVRRPPGSAYDACRALNRRLRLVRGLNPFVRDAWQTIVTQSQWPLVARYGSLFGTDDWHLLAGEAPWAGAAAPVPERLGLAAWWNRQHFWTTTAMGQALRAQTSLRALEGSLRKARTFAGRISDQPTGAPSLHDALLELDRSAARLIDHLQLSSPWPPPGNLELATPTARERRALLQLGAELDLERDGITVVATDGFLVLITGSDWTAEEYRTGLEALARVYRATGMLAFLYSPRSFALAPLTRRLRVLRAGDSSIGAAVPAEPLLLREQLFYQSLYLATHLWVAAGRSDPAGLERHVANALDACRFFVTGELKRDPLCLREALAQIESLDQGLSHRLRPVPGLERALFAGIDLEPAELFEVGMVVVEWLAEIMAGFDVRSDQVRVAAAS
jgi:Nucleotidyltransferase domain